MASDKDQRTIEIIVNGQKANANLKEMEGAARALSSQLKTLAPGTAEFVEKSAQLREVKANLTEVKDAISGVTREQTLMQEGFTRMLGAVAPLELIFKAIEFGKESFDVFKEGKQAAASLDVTLQSTAHAANMSREALDQLAESQQHNTLFTKDATQNAESLLLTFTNIKKGVYEQALPAIEDMATKMANGGEVDLKSTAIQVGKALNDPIKGITALSRVGVTFTEGQKDLIKSLMEQGKVQEAQKVILAEVNKEFGGSAAAARKAAGAQGDFKESMHELQESVGSLISDGLQLLYPIILQLVTGVLVLANGLRTMPAFIKENKELFIALGVALVSLNGANIAAAASSLAATAAEKGRAAATKASAAAEWLLNAAMKANPIGLVIAAVALLVGGFVKLYNSSQTVRAGIAGIAAAASAFFESVKKTAMQSLGGLAELLEGVFTFNISKIKAGAAALKDSFGTVGKDTAAAFHAGYQGKIDQEAAAAEAARKAAGKKKVEEAGAQGTAEGEEENSAQRKAREKREKEAAAAQKKAEAAAKKHQAELEKSRKEFHALVLKADAEFEKLKVEAMQDGLDKTLAKLKLERDQELVGLEEKRKATLANVAASAADKQHLLEQYHQTALMAEARYQTQVADARAKQAQKDAADRKKARQDEFAGLDTDEQDKLVVLDNGWLEQKLHLQKQTLEYMVAEQARADAELKLRKKTAAAKLAIIQADSKAEIKEVQKLKQDLLKIEDELATSEVDGEKRITEFKKQEAIDRQKTEMDLASAKIQLGSDVLDAVMSHLDQEGAAYQTAQALRKTLALAEIGVNLQKQLTNNAVTASEMNTALPGSGTAFQIVNDAIAVVGAAAAAAKVAGFAGGGFTGAGVGQIDATGHRVAGVVHDNEWVAPKWMLATPKFANVIGYLEAERRGYATGGYTGPASLPPSAAGGGSQADGATAAAVQQLTQIMLEHNDRINTWATNLGVDYHAGSAERVMQQRQQLKSGAGLGGGSVN
ncbi:hypothetical protein [Hymenobacter baengnokdamensis]|uniref:hypothetical protein n=1 Tax=Hymenobacter baengnokdamensis TaxID=2615203 RepID=UPI001244BC00|nr:hypothetical protein [Hymenobacter baengnokdamensis]